MSQILHIPKYLQMIQTLYTIKYLHMIQTKIYTGSSSRPTKTVFIRQYLHIQYLDLGSCLEPSSRFAPQPCHQSRRSYKQYLRKLIIICYLVIWFIYRGFLFGLIRFFVLISFGFPKPGFLETPFLNITIT